MPKISRRSFFAGALPLIAAQKPANTFLGIQTEEHEALSELVLQKVRPDYVQLEGIWADGACWRTDPDYSPATLNSWRQMGLGIDAPGKPQDPKWDVWLEFNRQRVRNCARDSIEKLQKERPGFPVASNSLYTILAPEKPELPIDFLVNANMANSRLETRYLAQSGKAWGLQIAAGQMKRDAAVALAQGGGIRIPYQSSLASMSELAQFCRERQSLCHKSQSLSDIAILFSRTSLYRKSNQLFGDWGKLVAPCTALLDAVIGCHRSVDVMPDWAPLKWPLLVIPEWEEIGDALAQEIASQVRGGLKLLLTGPINAKKFGTLFGRKLDPSQELTPHEIGKGRVVLVSTSNAVKQGLFELGPAQISIKDTSAPLELVLRKQGEHTVLHFLNGGNSLPGQQVILSLAQAPKKIHWEPSGRAIQFEWRDGYAAFQTPPIPLHAMAVID
jgi:hypothetical protein